jgi:hypothetical protein
LRSANNRMFILGSHFVLATSRNWLSKGAFTPNVKSMLSENLGSILGGTQCYMGDYLILSES